MAKFATLFNPFVVPDTVNELPSLTEQHFKEDVDINVLYKRFVKLQGFDPVTQGPEMVFDLSKPPVDYSAIRSLDDLYVLADEATEMFYRFPPEIREKFGNNPGNLRKAIESFGDDYDSLHKFGIDVLGGEQKHETTQFRQAIQQETVPADRAPDTQA